MADLTQDPYEFDFADTLLVLRKRKWMIIAIATLAAAAAFIMSNRQIPRYTSAAQVLVKPLLPSTPGLYPRLVSMDTEATIATSEGVATLAAEELGITPAEALSGISTSSPEDTDILVITSVAEDAYVASDKANALADSYLTYKIDSVIDTRNEQKANLEKRIPGLEKKRAQAQQEFTKAKPLSNKAAVAFGRMNQLIGEIAVIRSQLLALEGVAPDVGSIVSQAVPATSPSSPKPVRATVIAFLIGLGLAIGLSFARERLDEGINGRDNFESVLGAPVLAGIPHGSWKQRETATAVFLTDDNSAAAEAYRALRTNLRYIARDGGQVFLITSSTLGEGKTTTTANLAACMAATGDRVVAISADLRKPALHKHFELTNDVGLSDILQGRATAVDAIQRCGIESLRVIASGSNPRNPAELLGSASFGTLLMELRGIADVILIDSPPVLAVSDALILAPMCDGVIVVASAGESSTGALEEVRNQLDLVGANLVGGVLNDIDASQAKYYPGSYRYSYAGKYNYGYRDAHDDAGDPGESDEGGSLKSEALWDA